MRLAGFLSLALGPVLLYAGPEATPNPNPLQVSEDSFSFEIVDPTEPVEHVFQFHNRGSETIRIARIAVTPPLHVDNVTSKISPNQDGRLIVSLGTPREIGEYEGAIEVSFKNKDLAPLLIPFTGKITPVIEVLPIPALFVAMTRGGVGSGSLEIVNKDVEPLRITDLPRPNSRYELKLSTLEEGRRYRLDLVMRPEAKAGRQSENITLLTSSKKQPRIVIQANTLVRERVYAFPEKVDLGLIRALELNSNPALTNLINQTLMVYREGGKNFEITAETDLASLNLEIDRSDLGDRCEIRVQVVASRLAPGPMKGSIRIKTNDPEFPALDVPVESTVQ